MMMMMTTSRVTLY